MDAIRKSGENIWNDHEKIDITATPTLSISAWKSSFLKIVERANQRGLHMKDRVYTSQVV